MSNEAIQKKIDQLMKKRDEYIRKNNHWEANKIGEQVFALRQRIK